MNRLAQRALLWLKMLLPLIGAIGNVSKNAPIRHIAKPVLPITVKPASRRTPKKPAKASDIRIDAEDRTAPMCFVNLDPQCTSRVGDEKGILNANVVIMKVARPKYQILCSVQTPRRLEYAIEKNVLAKPTKMLVTKIVGSTMRIWDSVSTLT